MIVRKRCATEGVKRAKGPDVWKHCWRETNETGKCVQKKETIGDVIRFSKKAHAKREAAANLRSKINSQAEKVRKTTVADARGHFELEEAIFRFEG